VLHRVIDLSKLFTELKYFEKILVWLLNSALYPIVIEDYSAQKINLI